MSRLVHRHHRLPQCCPLLYLNRALYSPGHSPCSYSHYSQRYFQIIFSFSLSLSFSLSPHPLCLSVSLSANIYNFLGGIKKQKLLSHEAKWKHLYAAWTSLSLYIPHFHICHHGDPLKTPEPGFGKQSSPF